MSLLESLPKPLPLPVSADAQPVLEGWSLIDRLLAEQQQLTAVERFSQDFSTLSTTTSHDPAQARYYAALMPASPPGPLEQYAFEVDLDRCSGCKACVTACHAQNGLDEGETFRQVGLLVGGTSALPVLQHVTAACHHCLEPACATACPVNAYEKDPATGLVIHLDDQCFGCQYCTLACPYDVPQYHAAKGIVRKCDMCQQRLAQNEAPACVQACPHEAIRIRVVQRQQVIDDCETSQFLPGAYDPQFTLPTTTYKSARPLPRNLVPADFHDITPAHIHWSLVWMLVLTQLSVGTFVVEFWLTSRWGSTGEWLPLAAVQLGHVSAVTAWLIGQLALGAATLHLGRPHLAFRAILGLRHSWLSREIVAFGLFAALSSLYAAGAWWSWNFAAWGNALAVSIVVSGLLGVFCSAMIYEFTQRAYWSGMATIQRFLGSTLVSGAAIVLLMQATTTSPSELSVTWLSRLLLWSSVWKLSSELLVLRHLRDRSHSVLKRSAQLLTGALRLLLSLRVVCSLIGGVLLPTWVLNGQDFTLGMGFAIASLVFAGEVAERCLFFAAVIPHRMPGGVRS